MSSIAYVTEENMLEYHRLCRNRSILFWRLTTKNRFTDFRKGDLLFFFARGAHSRKKKGFIGYGHYAYTRKLSINQMWKQYGTMTGYDTKELLQEAIEKAAKGNVPESMLCLYLEDVVFFTAPIYPKEVGIDIPIHLESYCYIDKDDPQVTVKILKQADKYGIDLWSYNISSNPTEVFYSDVVKHVISLAFSGMPKECGNERERAIMHKLARAQSEKENWELIRGSRTDCMSFDGKTVNIALAFASNSQDRALRILELAGKMNLYRLALKKNALLYHLHLTVLVENEDEEIESLVKLVNE